jgi:transposase
MGANRLTPTDGARQPARLRSHLRRHLPGERLIVPDNITLLRLPPYAPELNPMENVCDYLRGNKLSSLVCDTYEGMRNASKEAWNFIANDPARTVSIGTRDWVCVNL